MTDQGKGAGFAAGVIIGTTIGALAVLILSPKMGKETREMLKEKGIELGKKVKESLGEAVEEGKKAASKAGAELKEKLEKSEKIDE